MAREGAVRRYRSLYAWLLRLYPRPYVDRFGASMELTFVDILRERAGDGRGLLGCVLWIFVETSAAIAKERVSSMVIPSSSLARVALGTGLLLLIPLVAMQFTDEVRWSRVDFASMGTLLMGTGLVFEAAARRADSLVYKAAVGVAVASAFLLVWVNLAVGIIGEPGGPNVMYLFVLLVGLVGAVAARLRSGGMVRAMVGMALAQMLVPMIALVVARSEVLLEPPGVWGVFALNACFAMLFVAAAGLFRRAGALARAKA